MAPSHGAPGAKSRLSYLLNKDEDASTPMPSAPMDISQPSHIPPLVGSSSSSADPASAARAARKQRPRKFVCPTCNFGFYTNSDLQKHISSVHLHLRPFECPSCDKKFGEKSNATKHYKSVHERQRNAACEQCDAVFAFRDGLARHVRLVHEGVRNFQCDIPGCTSAPFKQAAHLKKHKQSVHKIAVPDSGSRTRGSAPTHSDHYSVSLPMVGSSSSAPRHASAAPYGDIGHASSSQDPKRTKRT